MKKSFRKNNISVGLGNSCSGNGHGAGQSGSQRRSRSRKRIHLAWPGFRRCQYPTHVAVSYKGFSLSAWGTAGIEKEDTKEIDLTLGYATGGFSISVTDYWFNGGPGVFSFTAHTIPTIPFEAQNRL